MQSSIPKFSVVSPVYGAEASVLELADRVASTLESLTNDYEILLVEDSSPDRSWEKIKDACKKNPRVKGIKLSRNFGQHAAITAGLHHAKGEVVIVIDCDLQDDPEYIKTLYEKSQEGFDIVYTRKKERAHSSFKNITATTFNFVFNWLTGNESQKASSSVGSYSLLTRKVVDAFKQFNDYERHYLMVLRWLGFSHTYIDIEHKERPYGKSSYTLSKLIRHAVSGITSQSDKLLYLSISIGLIFFGMSVFAALYLVFAYFLHGFKEGWTSMMVLMLLSTGLILMSLGVVGIYLGKTFEQTKNRPLFLIDQVIND